MKDVDRSKLDNRNILAIVSHKNDQGFQLLTKEGQPISGTFYGNEIKKAPMNYFQAKMVGPVQESLSLRKVVTQPSLVGGIGMVSCKCTGTSPGVRCSSNTCICRKKGISCNSACHNSCMCTNK